MSRQNQVSIAALILLSCLTALSAAEPIDIGSRRELFVDRHLIEELDGVRFELHRPQPREVAIRFDKPWELQSPGYATIVRDEEKGRFHVRTAGNRISSQTPHIRNLA